MRKEIASVKAADIGTFGTNRDSEIPLAIPVCKSFILRGAEQGCERFQYQMFRNASVTEPVPRVLFSRAWIPRRSRSAPMWGPGKLIRCTSFHFARPSQEYCLAFTAAEKLGLVIYRENLT